jgi:hypothetical protein
MLDDLDYQIIEETFVQNNGDREIYVLQLFECQVTNTPTVYFSKRSYCENAEGNIEDFEMSIKEFLNCVNMYFRHGRYYLRKGKCCVELEKSVLYLKYILKFRSYSLTINIIITI